jgi:hypothetical protein
MICKEFLFPQQLHDMPGAVFGYNGSLLDYQIVNGMQVQIIDLDLYPDPDHENIIPFTPNIEFEASPTILIQDKDIVFLVSLTFKIGNCEIFVEFYKWKKYLEGLLNFHLRLIANLL